MILSASSMTSATASRPSSFDPEAFSILATTATLIREINLCKGHQFKINSFPVRYFKFPGNLLYNLRRSTQINGSSLASFSSSSSFSQLAHGSIYRLENHASIELGSLSSNMRSYVASEVIWRPPKPQRPPKCLLEATCTCHQGN